MQQAHNNKSPVKISGIKHSSNKRFHSTVQEYTITKQAKIVPTALEFNYNDEFSNNLCTVDEALQKDIYETVDLKVKVMKKEENKQLIVVNEKPRCKSDALIADNTNSIKLVLWENIIDVIQAGKCYHFKNLKVRIFGDTKYLNTNESTTYGEIENIEDVNLATKEIRDNLITGQCIAVQLKRITSCIVCNMALDKVQAHDEMITCKSCGNTTLEGMSKTKLVAQLTILTEDQKFEKFTCFNDALYSLINSTDGSAQSLSQIPLEDLKKLILKSGPRHIIADKATQVIAHFLPLQSSELGSKQCVKGINEEAEETPV